MSLWRTGLDRSLTNPDNDDKTKCSKCSSTATVTKDGQPVCNTHNK